MQWSNNNDSPDKIDVKAMNEHGWAQRKKRERNKHTEN